MVRSAILLLAFAAAASSLVAQERFAEIKALPAGPGPLKPPNPGSRDAVFGPLPFDAWLSQNLQSHIHWTARVSPPALSNYQRLSTRVEIEVDGPELAKRRGKGQFLMLIQFTDEHGGVWQFHESIDLAHVPPAIKNSDSVYAQSFFLLPGDYRVDMAVYDTATEEHSVIKRKLHVSPLHNDPLPGAWGGLPDVELIADDEPPNSWYLPFSGKLRLAVEPSHPVDIDLLVNLTPSEGFSASPGALAQNLSFLMPVFRVISQVEWRKAALNVSLIDLAHHRVAFRQDDVHRLEWRRARKSLAELNPGIIDVQALEQRRFNADFFLTEIADRIRQPRLARQHVVIVISSPVEFQAGQELIPIDFAARPDFKVYYLRCQEQPQLVFPGRPIGRRGRAAPKRLPRPANFAPEPDQLEPLLKPVDPHLYDVTTPEQVRRALAAMMAEIAKM